MTVAGEINNFSAISFSDKPRANKSAISRSLALNDAFTLFPIITNRSNFVAKINKKAERLFIQAEGEQTMCKEELFNQVLEVVSNVTGIAPNEIIKSRKEECSDARYILVKFLSKRIPSVNIGELLGRTRQGIGSILNRDKTETWIIKTNWKETVKQLESKEI